MGRHLGRAHRWAGIVGIAGLVLTAVFAGSTGPVGGQEDPHGHDPEGILPPGEWTEQQIIDAVHKVEDTEAALPQFADQSQLEELGFVNFRDPAPGGWSHWINRSWWNDEHILDPNFPESLVFRHTDQGDVLEAAMFFLPPELDLSTIPEELRWWPGWHDHEGELCEDEDELYFTGVAFGGCPEGSRLFVSGPMMHVWIVDNECGHRFAGIGIGGIECGDHDPHDPDPHDPDPHDPDPHDPEPPGPGPSSSTTTTVPTGRGTAPPARAVRGNPNYTG